MVVPYVGESPYKDSITKVCVVVADEQRVSRDAVPI